MSTTVLGQDQNGNLRVLPLAEDAGGKTVIPVVVQEGATPAKMDIASYSASVPLIGSDAAGVIVATESIDTGTLPLPAGTQTTAQSRFVEADGVTTLELELSTGLTRSSASFEILLLNLSATVNITIEFFGNHGVITAPIDTITLAAPVSPQALVYTIANTIATVAGKSAGMTPPVNTVCKVTATEPCDLKIYGGAR